MPLADNTAIFAERASDIIRSHRNPLEKLVAALEEQETLNRQQIDTLLGVEQDVVTALKVAKPNRD